MQATDTGVLSLSEQQELRDRESRIETGLRAFYEVGQELLEIRDKRLYRGQYATFEDYCNQRWSMSRPRAYELMASAEVVENLSAMADTKPTNERQTRPLTQLDPDLQAVAWNQAVAEAPKGKPTAAAVAAVVERLKNAPNLQPGTAAKVAAVDSPLRGQQVQIKRVEGAVAVCETEEGEEWPFMASELDCETPPPPPPPRRPHNQPPKVEPLTIDRLKGLIARVLEEVDPAAIPPDLYRDLQGVSNAR